MLGSPPKLRATLAQALVCLAIAAFVIACNDVPEYIAHDRQPPSQLSREMCDGQRHCEFFDSSQRTRIGGSDLLLSACDENSHVVKLLGTLSTGTPRDQVQWTASVRMGGVFPSGTVMATPVDCMFQNTSPDEKITLLVEPEGFADVRLAPGNVFVPMHGEAALDSDVHASVDLDRDPADTGIRTVTVLVAKGTAHPHVYRGLRADDVFPWAGRSARVVRIVLPDDGKFGPIGWIEIAVSDANRATGDAPSEGRPRPL